MHPPSQHSIAQPLTPVSITPHLHPAHSSRWCPYSSAEETILCPSEAATPVSQWAFHEHARCRYSLYVPPIVTVSHTSPDPASCTKRITCSLLSPPSLPSGCSKPYLSTYSSHEPARPSPATRICLRPSRKHRTAAPELSLRVQRGCEWREAERGERSWSLKPGALCGSVLRSIVPRERKNLLSATSCSFFLSFWRFDCSPRDFVEEYVGFDDACAGRAVEVAAEACAVEDAG